MDQTIVLFRDYSSSTNLRVYNRSLTTQLQTITSPHARWNYQYAYDFTRDRLWMWHNNNYRLTRYALTSTTATQEYSRNFGSSLLFGNGANSACVLESTGDLYFGNQYVSGYFLYTDVKRIPYSWNGEEGDNYQETISWTQGAYSTHASYGGWGDDCYGCELIPRNDTGTILSCHHGYAGHIYSGNYYKAPVDHRAMAISLPYDLSSTTKLANHLPFEEGVVEPHWGYYSYYSNTGGRGRNYIYHPMREELVFLNDGYSVASNAAIPVTLEVAPLNDDTDQWSSFGRAHSVALARDGDGGWKMEYAPNTGRIHVWDDYNRIIVDADLRIISRQSFTIRARSCALNTITEEFYRADYNSPRIDIVDVDGNQIGTSPTSGDGQIPEVCCNLFVIPSASDSAVQGIAPSSVVYPFPHQYTTDNTPEVIIRVGVNRVGMTQQFLILGDQDKTTIEESTPTTTGTTVRLASWAAHDAYNAGTVWTYSSNYIEGLEPGTATWSNLGTSAGLQAGGIEPTNGITCVSPRTKYVKLPINASLSDGVWYWKVFTYSEPV